MLDKVRNPNKLKSKFKNIVAYILFGAICLVFIFLDIGGGGSPLGRGGHAAIVNGKTISALNLSEKVRYEERRLFSQMKGLSSAQKQNMSRLLKGRALTSLIDTELIRQAAVKNGLVVSKKEMQKIIVGIPSFQKKGRFKPSLYQNYIRSRRMNAAQFEDGIRTDLLIQKMQQNFMASIHASRWETLQRATINGIQLHIAFVELDLNKMKGKNKSLKTPNATIVLEQIKQQIKQPGPSTLGLVNKIIKKYNLKWQSTGKFSLSASSIPKLGRKEEILQAALSLKAGELYKSLVLVNGKSYLVHLKSITFPSAASKNAAAIQKIENQINSEKTNSIFGSWVMKQREISKIIRSQ